MSDADKDAGEVVAWPTVLEEAFEKKPEGWSFAATTKAPPLRYDAPGVTVTLPGGETSVAAYWYEARKFSDVSITVTLVVLSAQEPTQSYCGVSFRALSDKDNYRLFIDGDGYYRLTKRVDNVSTALVDWTRHDALKPGIGEANRIQIEAEGTKITVRANGQLLTTVNDDAFRDGHIALQAQGGSPETESATVFAFRTLEISAPA
ncbi:MAG: DUF1080 domain-containing protein [Myxococcales bacterium]|nr:DUF1080 domain-containing protein [Myxococcales bacterium]